MAIVDPDFLFLRPMTARLDGAKHMFGWTDSEVPERVEKGFVVAQRWPMVYRTPVPRPWLPSIDEVPKNFRQRHALDLDLQRKPYRQVRLHRRDHGGGEYLRLHRRALHGAQGRLR